MKTGRLVWGLAFGWLLIPYLLLFPFFSEWRWPESGEFFWALKNSVFQATGSSLLAMIGAFFLLLGLLRVPARFRPWVSWSLLTPSLFPPLYVLLAFLYWLEPFPMGHPGIILIQGFMNAGLVAVLLLQVIESKLAGLSEAALVMGASRSLFFRRSFRLIAPEMISFSLFVFAVSFASFSIPFVVGGGRATTLEILIFEKVRISREWGEALSLSLIQLALISVFVFLPRTNLPLQSGRALRCEVWGSRVGWFFLGLYLTWFWGPLVIGLPKGIETLNTMPGLWDEILELASPTFLSSFAVGLTCLALMLIFAFGFPENGIPRMLRGWLAPSTALLGFAFLRLPVENPWVGFVAALALIFFPFISRLGWDRSLESLRSQIEVARSMGASDFLIWWRLLVPQIWQQSCLLAGVAALWALGEFALGKMVLGGPKTWALLSESLMSSYRIDAGLGLGLLTMLSGALLFVVFWGVAHVRR